MLDPATRLVRLLQLASPALPIGAYSYSQGLEWAVEAGVVRDAATAETWIGDALALSLGTGEGPMLARLLATAGTDWPAFVHWNAWHLASRETAELRAETAQMGHSLVKLALDLGLYDAPTRDQLRSLQPIGMPAAYALCAGAFAIRPDMALVGYFWSWLENQVLAAIKLVPLGQVAGQRLLVALGERIVGLAAAAAAMPDEAISTFTPGLALASAHHETQYSRLFRS